MDNGFGETSIELDGMNKYTKNCNFIQWKPTIGQTIYVSKDFQCI